MTLNEAIAAARADALARTKGLNGWSREIRVGAAVGAAIRAWKEKNET